MSSPFQLIIDLTPPLSLCESEAKHFPVGDIRGSTSLRLMNWPSWDSEEVALECPSCKCVVKGEGSEFHTHLVGCVMAKERRKPSGRGGRVSDVKKKAFKMMATITKLDLRSRISIMQSLHRLSRTSGVSRDGVAVSPRSGASDRQVLNLLYSRRELGLSPQKPRRRKAGWSALDAFDADATPPRKRFRKSFFSLAPDPLDLALEISDTASSSGISSCESSPRAFESQNRKRARSSGISLARLDVARSKIDEAMVRRIISEIDPTYSAAC